MGEVFGFNDFTHNIISGSIATLVFSLYYYDCLENTTTLSVSVNNESISFPINPPSRRFSAQTHSANNKINKTKQKKNQSVCYVRRYASESRNA